MSESKTAYGILKPMKVGRKQRGFTIIETLMVLAVTGGLFLVAAIALSGRQNKAQFEQAIQDVRSQVQQTVNEVATGYYPNNSNFNCTANYSTGPQFAGGSTAQGENTGCIFLGKVLQFRMSPTTSPEQFRVYTLAGLQKVSADGAEVEQYSQAKPKVVAPISGSDATPDASKRGQLLYGLSLQRISYGTAPATTNVGAIAFVNSLAPPGSSGGLISGSQRVNVVPISNSVLGATSYTAADTINTRFATSPVNIADGIRLCFVSGSTNQSGIITIGGNGRQTSVTLTIRSNKTCPA
jgi:prepilin-type N-terminal cleavage/methylation domain-containing protein